MKSTAAPGKFVKKQIDFHTTEQTNELIAGYNLANDSPDTIMSTIEISPEVVSNEKSGHLYSQLANRGGNFSEIANFDSNVSKCIPEFRYLEELNSSPSPRAKPIFTHDNEGNSFANVKFKSEHVVDSSLNLPYILRANPQDISKNIYQGGAAPGVTESTVEGEEHYATTPATISPRSCIKEYKNLKYHKPFSPNEPLHHGNAVRFDVKGQPSLQQKAFPAVTWLKSEKAGWKTGVYAKESAEAKKRTKRVIWKPPKATLIFCEPSSARGASCALNTNVAEVSFLQHQILDDSSFPTEHRLATSEGLQRAMTMARVAEAAAAQNRTAKTISYLTMSRETFAKTHNSLPQTSRVDLQLRYRQLMSHLKRQEYTQWENEVTARAGLSNLRLQCQPIERQSGRFQPSQQPRVCQNGRSKATTPRHRRTSSRVNSGKSKKLLSSANDNDIITYIHSVEATNRQFEDSSNTSEGPECQGQDEECPTQSPSFNPEPTTPQETAGDMPTSPGKPARDPATVQQGDAPSAKASENVCRCGDTESVLRNKRRNSCIILVQPTQPEAESKKHPDQCSCRSCVRTAEWINSIGVPSVRPPHPAATGSDQEGSDSAKSKAKAAGLSTPEPHDARGASPDILRRSEYSSVVED